MQLSPADFEYYIISLGCAKNQTDSERINSMLSEIGMNAAESAEDANIIIINTCGFIDAAKKETIEIIFDAINYRDNNKEEQKVVVTGCFSKRYFEQVTEEIPEIDFLYGLIDNNFLPEMCKKFDIKVAPYLLERRKPLISGYPYEYIKISEGCSNNCSYCAIPIIRGPIISYSPEIILKDANQAAKRGAKELIIIAQDIASYEYEGMKLPELLNKITEIDGPEWVRLLYCHPDHLNDQIIAVMKENKKIVPYLDIPFQHINKDILRSMNRKGDYNQYLSLIQKFRKEIPEIAIRSTFMVGYPGETEQQFQEILKFLSEAKLDRVGCFKYSKEEDTKAFDLEDLPEEIKEERYNRLMELQKEISIEKMKSRVGQKVQVIIEEKEDDNNWICRTEYDAPEVDGVFYLTASNVIINNIETAVVTHAYEYDLAGTL